MKPFKFPLLAIVMLITSALFYACSDDDNDKITPITLKDREDATIKIIYPTDHEYRYIIEGGDGDYSVKTDNPEVIVPEIIELTEASSTNQNLSLKVIGLGNAKVIITDKSQNSLILDLTVDYMTHEFTVRLIDVRVTGGDLTENEKKDIIEKQIALNPVKVDGGYKFIFNDLTTNMKGEATIYKDKYGLNGQKVDFNGVIYQGSPFSNSDKWGYELALNNGKRTFALDIYYPTTRETAIRPMALIEDVTKTVQKEYPKAESVIIHQVLKAY